MKQEYGNKSVKLISTKRTLFRLIMLCQTGLRSEFDIRTGTGIDVT